MGTKSCEDKIWEGDIGEVLEERPKIMSMRQDTEVKSRGNL